MAQALQVNVLVKDAGLALAMQPDTQRAWQHPQLLAWERDLELVHYAPIFGEKAAPELSKWFSLTFNTADTTQVISALRTSQRFEVMELNYARQMHGFTNDPGLSEQYYHNLIRTEAAWDSTKGGEVLVGVIDTGVDDAHPELSSKLWINTAEDINGNGRLDSLDFNGIDDDGNGFIDDVIGYDFVDQPLLLGGGDDLVQDPDPKDDNGHGTAVSGVIAAEANNNFGGAGIAPNTRLMTMRAFSAGGVGEDDDISRAIVYAADNGCKVLNLSFGDIYPSQLMAAACQYGYDRGMVIVSSAGNASGDLLAYPSGFPTVIAVSGSAYSQDTQNEFLWPFSNYGHTIDLCAPAAGIYTTWPADVTNPTGDSLLTTINGTSFAAPMVAAGAAMLLSVDSTLSPQQIRGILASSADDLDAPGWDHFTGGGRLNLQRALQFVGGVDVQILSPQNDAGTSAGSLPISANILHPQLKSAQLYYREGRSDSSSWVALGDTVAQQLIGDTIHTWDVAALDEGEYTLRLSVRLKNGKTTEDRVRVIIDRTKPNIEIIRAQEAWDDNRNGLFVSYRCDDIATCKLRFDGTSVPQERVFDKVVRNGSFYIPAEVLKSGGANWSVQCTNAAGLADSTIVQTATLAPRQIRQDGVTELDYSLPMGFYLTDPLDLAAPQVVYSHYDTQLNFGKLSLARFTGSQFLRVDSIATPSILIPKQFATPEGQTEGLVLSNLSDSTYMHRLNGAALDPQPVRRVSNGRFPIQFSDLDNDSQHELLMRDATGRYVYEWDGSDYQLMQEMPDPETNTYGVGSPRAAVGDLDADGFQEVWFGDYDGNLYGWEVVGDNQLELIQSIDNPQQVATSEYIEIADLNNDGLPELISASHSTGLRNADDEYDPAYWTLRIFSRADNDSISLIASTIIHKHFTADFNALTVRDLTGDNQPEILLTCFPRTYVFSLNDSELVPLWFGPGLADAHVVGDFNQNGTPEFCIGLGDRAPFFELGGGVGESPQLSAEVRADDSIRLSWTSVPNASAYTLYRQVVQDTLGPNFQFVDNVALAQNLTDDNVQLGQEYAYFVIALVGQEQVQSNLVRITPQPQIACTGAKATSDASVRLQFSGRVAARESDLSLFTLNTGQQPAQMMNASGTSVLIQFEPPLEAGNYTVTIDSSFLDANQRRIAPNSRVQSFTVGSPQVNPLIFKRWEKQSPTQARLYMSEPVEASTLVPKAFSVRPEGRVVAARFADDTRTVIDVELKGARLSAVGYTTSIRMTALAGSDGGVIVPGQGDVAGFVETGQDISSIYAYPNPVDRSAIQTAGGCRFANVPEGATITLMTSTGFRVRSLQETDADGGVHWDLRDNTGTQVRSGVYLYKVTLDGQDDVLGKVSVVR